MRKIKEMKMKQMTASEMKTIARYNMATVEILGSPFCNHSWFYYKTQVVKDYSRKRHLRSEGK